MIEAHDLVKRHGSTTAVNDLSFSIRPGLVTGFLGPNGAGKTTTMRSTPRRCTAAAFDHLLCLAQSNGIPRRRVDEVLRIVGLKGVARRRAKGFSLGMSQRLGIASALLGTRPCSSCHRRRRSWN
jgi:ABC-2 type transport system ATP-binding protein